MNLTKGHFGSKSFGIQLLYSDINWQIVSWSETICFYCRYRIRYALNRRPDAPFESCWPAIGSRKRGFTAATAAGSWMVLCCWTAEAFIFAGYRSYSIGRDGHVTQHKPYILSFFFVKYIQSYFVYLLSTYPLSGSLAGKFPLMSIGGWAEGLACADPGARTPIGVSVKIRIAGKCSINRRSRIEYI